jgi:ribosomal protein S21
MKVEVRNNNVERAMQVLKRKLVDEGVFKELQERRFYEKPSDRQLPGRDVGSANGMSCKLCNGLCS